MELPEFTEPQLTYPTLLLLSGMPGLGKSSLIAGLNTKTHKALHIDLQGGAAHVGGNIWNIKKIADDNGWSLAQALKSAIKTLKEKNKENGKPVYDFVTIDPLASLKPVIVTLGTRYYNESVIGKAAAKKAAEEKFGPGIKFTPDQLKPFYSKDVVADIGQNGWNFLNMGWKELFEDLLSLAGKCTIFIAHTKYNTLKKTELSELSVKEIDFWPSYLLELVGTASDSASLMRRENEVIASFVFNDNHSHFKSRHFDGQEIVLSTKEGNTITTHWERIFPFLAEKV